MSVGVSGDGGPATSAELSSPFGVAVTADGGFLIADSGSQRVRKVSAAGTITTVAGTGTYGFSGDGGPATSAQLKPPYGVAETADGGFLIADTDNQRVRRVIGPPPPAPPPPAPPPAAAPPPAPLPDVALFNLSPSSVNVAKSGRFTYTFVATPGRAAKLKLASTKRVMVASKRRKITLSKTFTAPADATVKTKLKLTRASLNALKHAKTLRFQVTITIGVKTFTTTLSSKRHRRPNPPRPPDADLPFDTSRHSSRRVAPSMPRATQPTCAPPHGSETRQRRVDRTSVTRGA